MRRVVVTGLGVLSPIGIGVKENWDSLMQGKSGIAPITRFNTLDHPVTIAGEVKNFNPEQYMNPKITKQGDLFVQYAVACAKMAMDDSGLNISDHDPTRIGTLVGAGLGGLPEIEHTHSILLEKGPKRISPFFIPRLIANMAGGQISIVHGAKGPNACTVTACTSGTHSISDAFRIIQCDEADVMIAGGTESTITPLCVGGFAAMKALSRRNHEPTKASRPFDKDRDGFVVGEGCGLLILEELEFAKKRGAKIYCELLGAGMSADAFHLTLPAPEGEGAQRSMKNALTRSKVNIDEVTYINAHGTSTPANDANESLAIKHVFKDHAKKLKVSSTKSMTGHLLGGAGGIEAVYSVLSISHQALPPTINYETPDPECDLDYVPNQAQACKVDVVISNSFGFGGTNGSLLFRKFS